jgi:carbon-monoxide dehydrogenase large subunit
MSDFPVPTGKLVGARVNRVEDPRFLTGDARFIGDLSFTREVHCAFVRSTVPHAILRGIDADAAARMPGVIAVFTGQELETVGLVDPLFALETLARTPQPALPTDRVRFVGEAIAVIVAEDRARAEDAAEAVAVDYEPLEPVVDVERAMEPEAPRLFEHLDSNVVFRDAKEIGDVAGAFAAADRVYERQFHTNRFMAAPMETRGVIADFERSSGRLVVWSSTQTPHLLRLSLATALSHPAQRIRIITPEVGGGFGQKMACYPEEVVVAAIAKRLCRPVKWIEDRRENLLAATHAKEQVVDMTIAVDMDGKIRAIRARYIGDSGAFSFNTASALIEPSLPVSLMPSVYAVTACAYEVVAVLTNKTPIGPYRGVGWTAGHTARELLLDEIARDLGLTPEELRRRNLLADDVFPYQSPMGPLYDSGSYVQMFDRALEMIDAQEFRRAQAAAREEGRYLGLCISPWVEPTGYGTDVAMQTGFPLASHDNAKVTMDPTGKVFATVSIPSQGQGHETTFGQVVADTLGVGLDDVVVSCGDTDVDPWGMGTYSSRAAVVGSGALGLAAGEVRRKLLAVASKLLEAAPEDLAINDGKIGVVGVPQRTIPVADVAVAAYFAPGIRDEDDPALVAERFYDPGATYSSGCVAVIVEVDVEIGKVVIRRIVAVEDCGTMLNPMIVEGQLRGAIAQGIGGALLEELVYEEDGQLVTTTYLDYLLPTAPEVPHIEIGHLESPSPFTAGGVKGMGESGLIATPAAVIGAVADALAPVGAVFDRFPLKPDRVLRAAGRLSSEPAEIGAA